MLILPNILVSVALAKQSLLREKDESRLPTSESLDQSLNTLLSHEGHLNALLDSPDPETFLIAVTLLYP